MSSVLASYVQRLAGPPPVEIFVVLEPWPVPTRTILFSGGCRKAGSISTAVQFYTISFLSCTLLLSSHILCSSAPVKRLKPDEMLRQPHFSSPQHLLLTSAPNEMASSVSGVPHLIRRPAPKARGTIKLCFPLHTLIIITPLGVCHNLYSGERFCSFRGYISSPICLAVQPVHSDVTSFRSAAPFISSSRSLDSVQFGDPNPSNITIWAWPIKGYKEICIQSLISLIRRVLIVSVYWSVHRDNLHHYHLSFARGEPYYPVLHL